MLTAAFLQMVVFQAVASAQLSGFNIRGDYGLQSATQPSPGFHLVAPFYHRYHIDTFKDANGDPLLPGGRVSNDIDACVLGLIWVTDS